MQNIILTLALSSVLFACGRRAQQPRVGAVVEVAVVEDTAPAVDVALEEPAQLPVSGRYALRRGETLAHFARWAELPLEAVAASSDIPLDGRTLTVGTEVVVPLGSAEHGAEVERARDVHHQLRADGYLASRGGSLRSEEHTVRSGETAWSIARDHGNLPVWLVESMNPSVNVDDLRPGHRLVLPVIAMTIATAESGK